MARKNESDEVKNNQFLAKDEILVNEGDPFRSFYIVRSGGLKTYTSIEGIEQITGFYLPGEIVGLDCITSKIHNNSIKSLANTLTCQLEYDKLMELLSYDDSVRNKILELMSLDILNHQKMLSFFSQKQAEERLATFIYLLYNRYLQKGHSSLTIELLMSRSDIANYLGLTIETISRMLRRMQNLKIFDVKGKYIHINSLSALQELMLKNKK